MNSNVHSLSVWPGQPLSTTLSQLSPSTCEKETHQWPLLLDPGEPRTRAQRLQGKEMAPTALQPSLTTFDIVPNPFPSIECWKIRTF